MSIISENEGAPEYPRIVRTQDEAYIAQLEQLVKQGPVKDGNLISKAHRDLLVDDGLIDRRLGYNFLTPSGISFCVINRLLNS